MGFFKNIGNEDAILDTKITRVLNKVEELYNNGQYKDFDTMNIKLFTTNGYGWSLRGAYRFYNTQKCHDRLNDHLRRLLQEHCPGITIDVCYLLQGEVYKVESLYLS